MQYQGKEYYVDLDGVKFHCALDIAMHYIGGKWKAVILWYLRKETLRFSELNRKIPQITEKMLSTQLRNMERDKFVGRRVYPEVPPRVEYFLTEEGKRLIPVVEELAKWGRYKAKADGKLVESKTKKLVKVPFI
jgi:DNA-binding HxlR family transcriptional regulator